MTASTETPPFSYGHFYAKIPRIFQDEGKRWIQDVNNVAYPETIRVLGFSPQINNYIVEFTSDPSKPEGWYDGIKTVDGVTGGHIVLHTHLLQSLPPYPKDLEGGLVYETIHGFLQPLKFRHQWSERTVLAVDESFDILFEAELGSRLGLNYFVECLYRTFYPKSSGQRYFGVLWDIREKFNWAPFQKFFRMLNESPTPLAIDDDTLCYYLSKCVGADVTLYFIKHGFYYIKHDFERQSWKRYC